MFIKEAYERRINQQKLQEQLNKKRKKQQSPCIGSAKNNKLDFTMDQSFFTSDNIPHKAKQAKKYIQYLTNPDYLKLKPKQWNSSVDVPKRFQDEQSEERKLLNIRLGFNDFKDVQFTGNKVFLGTQTRNNYTGWNVSTFVQKHQKQQGLHHTNMSAFDNSSVYSSKKLKNYLTPINKYKINEQLRINSFAEDTELLNTMKSIYKFQNPYASPQKTNALMLKQLQQKKRMKLKEKLELSQMKTQDTFKNFKASLSPTQKSKIHTEYYHTGVWQSFKGRLDQQQQWIWSCCMNEQQKSRGCVKRIVDGNKLNFSSYNNE